MCGIVGYVGRGDIKDVIIDGLKELEYRGYDSAGIAIVQKNNKLFSKAQGKLTNLIAKVKNYECSNFGIGIGHTRWATHGIPNEENAHPHYCNGSYISHNGIIENHETLKHALKKHGAKFTSQTDSEVIVHLFEYNFQKLKNAFSAFRKTVSALRGSYAILLMSSKCKDTIFFARLNSPLMIGFGEERDTYLASSDSALLGKVKNVSYLLDGTYGYVNPKDVVVFKNNIKINPKKVFLKGTKESIQKGGFRYFMEKEIYEQGEILGDVFAGRLLDDCVFLQELKQDFIKDIKEIKICACGSSYYASMVAFYLFERVANIKTSIEVSSEFRYRKPYLSKETLFITISQSGETADTLEALKVAKTAGLKTVAICNVDNSSIVRQSDVKILLRAGIEKGVASTKAFTAQVCLLWMFILYFAKLKGSITDNFIKKEVENIRAIPSALKVKKSLLTQIKPLAKKYSRGYGFFYIGRDIFYPLALEGALKLKEISYLHAEGYQAGEMKHGPIALADKNLVAVVLISENLLFSKMKSSAQELLARDSNILFITSNNNINLKNSIKITKSNNIILEFFKMLVSIQLFAMEVAIELGNNVDMPRNLAKSVTVE